MLVPIVCLMLRQLCLRDYTNDIPEEEVSIIAGQYTPEHPHLLVLLYLTLIGIHIMFISVCGKLMFIIYRIRQLLDVGI